MEKIIKQLAVLGVAAAMALSFGCGMPELIDDLRSELNDDEDFAPTSLAGRTFYGTRTSNSGDFTWTGNFTLTFTETTFSMVNAGGSTETGTYTYSNSFNFERIVLSGLTRGWDVIYNPDFTSWTTGSYYASAGGGTEIIFGQETGTFVLSGGSTTHIER